LFQSSFTESALHKSTWKIHLVNHVIFRA